MIRTLAGTALVWMAVPVAAQRQTIPSPHDRRQALQELGLSPGQRRQLVQLRRSRHQEQMQIAPLIRARRQELAELYRAYSLDEGKASELIQQIAQLEAQRLRTQLQNQVELRRILTREQFSRFTQMVEPPPHPAPPLPARATGP